MNTLQMIQKNSSFKGLPFIKKLGIYFFIALIVTYLFLSLKFILS